jgi:hypothetical protein
MQQVQVSGRRIEERERVTLKFWLCTRTRRGMQVLAEVNVKYLLTRTFQDSVETGALWVGVTGLGKYCRSSPGGDGGGGGVLSRYVFASC